MINLLTEGDNMIGNDWDNKLELIWNSEGFKKFNQTWIFYVRHFILLLFSLIQTTPSLLYAKGYPLLPPPVWR